MKTEVITGLGKMWVSGDPGKNHCNGVNTKLKVETVTFDNLFKKFSVRRNR